MRWLRWPISTFIVLLLPIWLLLLIPKLNGFGPTVLKSELKQHGAYEQLSSILHQQDDQPNPGQSDVTDQALVVLRSALTVDYIEGKTNTAIDDTSAWINRRTDTEPALDLNDIKDRVLTVYPDAQSQISQLQSDLAAAQQELKEHPMPVDGVEGLESDGSASTEEIAKLLQETDSLHSFVAGDFRINLGPTLTPLYQLYQYYQIAIPVLAILITVLLIGFIVSSKGWQARLKNLGWLCVATAVVNGVLVALFSTVILKIGLDAAIGMLPGQAEVVGSIGRAVIESLFANYVYLEAIITVSLFVVGLTLLITTLIIAKQQRNQPKTIPHEPDLAEPMASQGDAPDSLSSESK